MHEKTDAQTRWWMGRIPLCFLFLSFDGGDPMVPGRGIDCPVILCVCQISAGVTGSLCHHGLPSSTSAAAQLSPVAGKDRMQLCGGVLFLHGRGFNHGGRSQYSEHDLSNFRGADLMGGAPPPARSCGAGHGSGRFRGDMAYPGARDD